MKTLTEANAHKKFEQYARQLIKVLGRKATTGKQIDTVGKRLFGNKYMGSYAQDDKSIPWRNNKFYIINTDKKNGPGIHWVSLYNAGKTAYLYDSYGRNHKSLLRHLTKQLKEKNIKIVNSDQDKEQSKSSAICGPLSLAWLAVVHNYGIRSALKI